MLKRVTYDYMKTDIIHQMVDTLPKLNQIGSCSKRLIQ
jgi:hypothetical protein